MKNRLKGVFKVVKSNQIITGDNLTPNIWGSSGIPLPDSNELSITHIGELLRL